MPTLSFYHLTSSPLEKALPRLMEKVFESGGRALIRTADESRAEVVTEAMWTYSTQTFIPHGSKKDGYADQQPIFITASNENPNGATILVLIDGLDAEDIQKFDRCLFMFDGADDTQVQQARSYWKKYKATGAELTYWKQNPKGGWDKEA